MQSFVQDNIDYTRWVKIVLWIDK